MHSMPVLDTHIDINHIYIERERDIHYSYKNVISSVYCVKIHVQYVHVTCTYILFSSQQKTWLVTCYEGTTYGTCWTLLGTRNRHLQGFDEGPSNLQGGPRTENQWLHWVTILLIGGYNNPLVYLVGANCV